MRIRRCTHWRGIVKRISKIFSCCFVGVLILSLNSVAEENKRIKVIYGKDDRLDVYQVSDPGLLNMASATAAIISKSKLSQANGAFSITGTVFGDELGLCKDEPFYNQIKAANCSSFLVGPDLVATAGHCISALDCADYAFVFNYKMVGPGQNPTVAQANDVYKCKQVIAREQTKAQDYSLVRLDRQVVGRIPVALAQNPAKSGDPLVLIGNPSGIPTKIAGGANVRKVEKGFFRANTDSYGGNSGSGVFNAAGEVVGILVRGEQDFKYDISKQCTRSYNCLDGGCRGEDATQIDFIIKAIQAMPAHNDSSER